MSIERKFIDLKALKVSKEGNGAIEGYRAVYGEVDEGGDIIVKGFFKDSIEEYLRSGFTAHSHDWDFDKAVGYPTAAVEDDYGFNVRSEFHSTADAQAVRTKAVERFEAGKTVGFSFGYSVKDKSYIEAKDYKEQLPLYVKADRLAANLKKAANFDRVRILKSGEVIEDSIVTAPMNKLAMATGIKDSLKDIAESGLSDESFEIVVSAIEKFTQKMQSNHDNRTKDGRVLSASNRAKVQSAYDALGALLEASDVKPKEPKGADMEALRTQSFRLQREGILTLVEIAHA